MKLCPACGKIATYNDYFGAYICTNCNWKDYTPEKERLAIFHNSDIDMQTEKKEYYCARKEYVKV